MNTKFLAIIKQIVFQQGEAILADPQRLKPLVSDLAKDEPKTERVAFGRCIEQGCYHALKQTASAAERQRVKAALSQQMQTRTGIDAASCAGALDLLEAVIFGAAAQGSVPAGPFTTALAGQTGKGISLSRKTIVFGIAGGAGALVGEVISLGLNVPDWFEPTRLGSIGNISAWAGFISLFVSAALLAAQFIHLKKTPDVKTFIKPVLLGLATGILAGGFAQFVFNYTQHISSLVRTITNVLCWGIFGCGLGLGVSLFVPNFPKGRAAAAGAIGGTIGGAIYVAAMSSSSDIGGIIGVVVLGFAIGLTISFVEEALRQAWLTVIWGKNETTTVSLGEKPVAFGPSKEADIYLPGDADYPVRISVQIEAGKVLMHDRAMNQRRELQNGSRVDLGKLSFVVNIKK